MIRSNPQTIQLKGELLSLDVPVVMGIINATPDSFFDRSRAEGTREVVELAAKHLREGATILDVGGYSTRPGARDVSIEEEKGRVREAVKAILSEFPDAYISVDTFRAEVAEVALTEGAAMVNDVSGGTDDAHMWPFMAESRVPFVVMHKQGKPKTMQVNPRYDDVVEEVLGFVSNQVDTAQKLGIPDLIIDPGFGFGKTLDHNYELLQNLSRFQIFEKPILVGVSRKSMINSVLEIKAKDALNGTTAIHAWALDRGAGILRVHDVKEAVEVVKLHQQLKKR
jgi:dihydropteroate synthase